MAPSTKGSEAAGPGAGRYQTVWPEACVGLSCGHVMWFVVLSGSCGLQEGECGVAAQRGGALGRGPHRGAHQARVERQTVFKAKRELRRSPEKTGPGLFQIRS